MEFETYRDQFAEIADPEKILRHLARTLSKEFAAQVRRTRYDKAWQRTSAEGSNEITEEELRAALERRAVRGHADRAALELVRDERDTEIFVLVREGEEFSAPELSRARRLLRIARDELGRRDGHRRRRIVERTYDHLLRRLRGNDLHYRILHALRDLARYDHSASVLVFSPERGAFRLQAEQIAWTKGKSTRIGALLPAEHDHAEFLEGANHPHLFRREGEEDTWRMVDGEHSRLASRVWLPFLDHHLVEAARPPAASAVLTPLVSEGDSVGVLALFGLRPLSLGHGTCTALLPLAPLAATAIRNQRIDEGLEATVLAAERKHAMADLARSVAHDINNALGVLVPRAQMLREALESHPDVEQREIEDACEIERNARMCSRIFQGMMAFARRGAQPSGRVDLGEVIEDALRWYRPILEGGGVRLRVQIEANVPPVHAHPEPLERVIHNLLENARQACSRGGRVRISLCAREGQVRLAVADDGHGIPPDVLPHVFEPFYGTRRAGHGLGLAVSRSIVVDLGGTLRLASRPARGTLAVVRLPFARIDELDETQEQHQR